MAVVIAFSDRGGCGDFARVISSLASHLAGSSCVLMAVSGGKRCAKIANILGAASPERPIAAIRERLGVGTNLVRGYLSAGIENTGLIYFDKLSDIEGHVATILSKIYPYILIDIAQASEEEVRPLFPFINRFYIVSRPDTSSLRGAEERLKKLRRMNVDGESLGLIVTGDAGGRLPDAGAIREKLNSAVYFYEPEMRGDFAGSVADIDFQRTMSGDLLKKSAGGLKEKVLDQLSSSREIKKLIDGGEHVPGRRPDIESMIEEAVHNCLDKEHAAAVGNRESFVGEIIDEAIGLGPVERFMKDDTITEIMVNSKDEIYIERGGKIERAGAAFAGNKALMSVIERIVSPVGRRVDESSPVVDARLSDGSRVHVIIPPLSLNGPVLTIRKFAKNVLTIDDLAGRASLDQCMAKFLDDAVKRRLNILISGGTGSGKTTLLNVLSSFICEDERIITIEDSAELKLNQGHVVRLESRPPNIEGKGEITIRDLVRASLRMRPDRIIVGECRGAEALDMLQAMNTGHDGSLTTIHANSCRDALGRIQTLVLFAGFELPVKAIREQIASAIDLIVQVRRLRDGSRKIVNISELTGLEGDVITLQDLFTFENGRFIGTGFRPKFLGSDGGGASWIY